MSGGGHSKAQKKGVQNEACFQKGGPKSDRTSRLLRVKTSVMCTAIGFTSNRSVPRHPDGTLSAVPVYLATCMQGSERPCWFRGSALCRGLVGCMPTGHALHDTRGTLLWHCCQHGHLLVGCIARAVEAMVVSGRKTADSTPVYNQTAQTENHGGLAVQECPVLHGSESDTARTIACLGTPRRGKDRCATHACLGTLRRGKVCGPCMCCRGCGMHGLRVVHVVRCVVQACMVDTVCQCVFTRRPRRIPTSRPRVTRPAPAPAETCLRPTRSGLQGPTAELRTISL